MSLKKIISSCTGAIAFHNRKDAEIAAHVLRNNFPNSSVKIKEGNAFFVLLDDEDLSQALLESRFRGGFNAFCVAVGWEPN